MPVDVSGGPIVPSFPLAQFLAVPASSVTAAMNDLIVDVNAAMLATGGGAGAVGYVTRRQLFTALAAQGKLQGLDVTINATAVSDPAVIEYRAALSSKLTGPLAALIQSSLSYTTAQMTDLWALAAQQLP